MIETSCLFKALKDLESELKSSGKIETAFFFEKMASSIEDEKKVEKIEKELNKLIGSSAIIQYANFSFQEEILFNKCIDEAEKLIIFK